MTSVAKQADLISSAERKLKINSSLCNVESLAAGRQAYGE